jgi:bis(5'-nucleosidyl)-tetraphosphatase
MDAKKSLRETSYGIIPLKQMNCHWITLLIQHYSGHWAFPKGHSESGETPIQTAKRELFEETGLSVSRLFSLSPLEEQYCFIRKKMHIFKSVQYFLAEVEGAIRLQSQEISGSIWVRISEAEKYATFPETQNLCRQVVKFFSCL